MLYGIEVNEPYQANAEFKIRCLMSIERDTDPGWTPHVTDDNEPNPIAFATSAEGTAKQIAGLLPASADAQVVPLEAGREVENETALIQAFGSRRRFASSQARQIR